MTDNRTTELLPCPFCGGEAQIVEGMYSSFQEGYAVRCRHCALTLGASGRLGECYEWSCSFATEAEAITAWNTRTHGTLTAEQVMATAWRHQPDYCSDTHVCFDWQAIADELNAELGRGTCELIDTTSPGNDDYWNSAKCSECGAEFTCAIFGRDRRLPDANYCPNCGRKAVG